MLGNCLLRHVEGSGQFADCSGSTREPGEDRPTRRVGERRKRNAQTIHNRMVVHSHAKVNRIFLAFDDFALETLCWPAFWTGQHSLIADRSALSEAPAVSRFALIPAQRPEFPALAPSAALKPYPRSACCCGCNPQNT